MDTQVTLIHNFLGAENKMSVLLTSGSRNDYNNKFFAKNWFISAFARPDCPKCYSNSLGRMCAN